jgi:hypothetical protein
LTALYRLTLTVNCTDYGYTMLDKLGITYSNKLALVIVQNKPLHSYPSANRLCTQDIGGIPVDNKKNDLQRVQEKVFNSWRRANGGNTYFN